MNSVVKRDVIAIGASAGGVRALMSIVRGLPPGFEASLLVVLHMPSDAESALAEILTRSGPLPARQAIHGEALEHGRIYVARPDHHLIVNDGSVYLSRGPKENLSRPSADVLFRSAAESLGTRLVGVVLTGRLDDGASGLQAICEKGGVTIVQDPDEAEAPGMPLAALRTVWVDYCLRLEAIPSTLVQLVQGTAAVPERPRRAEAATAPNEAISALPPSGPPSGLTCPECGGAIWETARGEVVRYTCHVGHIYHPQSMLQAQSEVLESALWAAIRSLKERAALLMRLAENARRSGTPEIADRFVSRSEEPIRSARIIESLLLQRAERESAAAEGDRPV